MMLPTPKLLLLGSSAAFVIGLALYGAACGGDRDESPGVGPVVGPAPGNTGRPNPGPAGGGAQPNEPTTGSPPGSPPAPPQPMPTAPGSGVLPPPPGLESTTLDALRTFLAQPVASRPPIAEQGFAAAPLSLAGAREAATLLWEDLRAEMETARRAELQAKTVTAAGKTMRYDLRVFGTAPPTGRSLFISMHGGGMASAAVNDGQWRNQITLYRPSEGIYLAPRAPSDNWNLWHEGHIDPLFDRLISNFVAFEGVDPDRVYVMGYSAGGDGVFQLAPRMADRWAAAAMMAGHPNDASPRPVRNIGYTLHVGALDTAFMRNLKVAEWGTLLDGLQAADPTGYVHDVQVHAGKPHWMDLEDAVAVPWMQKFTRKPLADKVIWVQDDITQTRFYWLAVEPAAAVKKNTLVVARDGAHFRVEESTGTTRFALRLTDEMTDLDQPITVTRDGKPLLTIQPVRTIATLARTLAERELRSGMFSAEVWVD